MRNIGGFTLAELLIALAILGVIATFTIPKVLQTQQSGQYKANAKEVAAMFSGAWQAYRQNNALSAGTIPGNLSPFMNYVGIDTVTVIDNIPTFASRQCSNSEPCLKLHNGGMMMLANLEPFGGTSTSRAIYVIFDPDATYSGSTLAGAPGKSVAFVLYTNGFITSRAHIKDPTCVNAGCYSPGAFDPTWFDWN